VPARRWAHDMGQTWQRVRNFKIQDAACAVESDRPVVERNIMRFMELSGRANIHSCRAEALEAFNKLVRTEVPAAIRASLHTRPYLFFITLALGSTVELDFFAGQVYYGHYSIRTACLKLVELIVEITMVTPLTFGFLVVMIAKCLELRGVIEWAYILGVGLLSCAMNVGVHMWMHWLVEEATVSGRMLAVFVCAALCLLITTAVCFLPGFFVVRRWLHGERELPKV